MSSWSGFRSSEFGAFPISLDFAVESHLGPGWVVPAIVHRSGWLMAAEVVMETTFDRTCDIIYACTDDNGDPLGKWVTEALFSMHSGFPNEAESTPPDELDDALDALYWDFLGRCDVAHLHELEAKEARTALSISSLESKRKDIYEKVDTFISGLYARRRRDPSLRNVINAKIEEIETKQIEAEDRFKKQIHELNGELKDFDTQVMESLQNHGTLTRLFTIHWTAKASHKKRLAKKEVAGYWQPPNELRERLFFEASVQPVGFSRQSWSNAIKDTAEPRTAETFLAISGDARKLKQTKKPAAVEFSRLLKANLPPPKADVQPVLKNKFPLPTLKKASKQTRARPKLLSGQAASKALAFERPQFTPHGKSAAANQKHSRPNHVIIGDRVLMRLEGLDRSRFEIFVQIIGDLSKRGVLGIMDDNALAILDKHVGDRVTVNFGTGDRLAVIEKILNFDSNS